MIENEVAALQTEGVQDISFTKPKDVILTKLWKPLENDETYNHALKDFKKETYQWNSVDVIFLAMCPQN